MALWKELVCWRELIDRTLYYVSADCLLYYKFSQTFQKSSYAYAKFKATFQTTIRGTLVELINLKIIVIRYACNHVLSINNNINRIGMSPY